jgi:hypothetical protein
MSKRYLVLCAVLCGFAACPGTPNIPGGKAGGLNPDSCGRIDTNPVGKKLYAFLQASADLDKASVELEASVAAACRKMARELGVPDTGGTKEVCERAATELEANLKVSVKSESRLVTRYKPPACHTEIDFAAGVVAKCEAKVEADVNVRCDGHCEGTCAGTCSTGDEGGACAGVCQGKCSGKCDGYCSVDASAECKASAEVRANVNTVCDEPKIEVVRENVTIVDDTKFQKAMRAIDAGMPAILRATKKLEYAGKAAVFWAKTAVNLAASSGELVKDIGERGLCVAGQLAAAVAASAQIQARFEVSISVTARVSASAGAQPQ